MDYSKKALDLHKKLGGKVVVSSKLRVKTRDLLSALYTPGVGAVSSAIARKKELAWRLTGKHNSIAIVTDGTAVLGLGNIGPEAAIPVMEGKSVLFSEFGEVSAYPLCIRADTADEIAAFVRAVAPNFGGINLEDIAAPMCFEIEEKLKDIGIPVFHDDQDGTAIVVLAALMNAVTIVKKKMRNVRVVILGAGAAGAATAWFLTGREKWQAQTKIQNLPFDPPADVILVDSKGIIEESRSLTPWKRMLAAVTNKDHIRGDLDSALRGADILIGLSSGGKVTTNQIQLMKSDPIIFALANPVPEILPSEAKKAGAVIIATGRSDFPNQINNAFVFPGLFRGLLDAHATRVSTSVKYAVSETLAKSTEASRTSLLPSILDKTVHRRIAQTVKKIAS